MAAEVSLRGDLDSHLGAWRNAGAPTVRHPVGGTAILQGESR